MDDLIRLNHYQIGSPMIATGAFYQFADDGVDISLGYVNGGAWGAGSQAGAVAATFPTMESSLTSNTQKPEVYTADAPTGFMFMGVAPYMCGFIPFDIDPNPSTWLDPASRFAVECNIHTRNAASAAAGRNAVVLDRLVRY
jgi:hypothetical protein